MLEKSHIALDAASDSELLSNVLYGNVTQHHYATTILQHHHSLHGLMNDLVRDRKSQIINTQHCQQLLASYELQQRILSSQLASSTCYHKKMLHRFLRQKLRYQTREIFSIVLFNSQKHYIHYQEIFHGSLKQSTIYPREVVKQALHYNCAYLICAHNHPSGDTTISNADKAITQHLHHILRTVDVTLLDHIIIANHNISLQAKHPELFL